MYAFSGLYNMGRELPCYREQRIYFPYLKKSFLFLVLFLLHFRFLERERDFTILFVFLLFERLNNKLKLNIKTLFLSFILKSRVKELFSQIFTSETGLLRTRPPTKPRKFI